MGLHRLGCTLCLMGNQGIVGTNSRRAQVEEVAQKAERYKLDLIFLCHREKGEATKVMSAAKKTRMELMENEEFREDFRMWYQITIDDIKFLKRQQWQTTYYVLLLQGALVGFFKLVTDNGDASFGLRFILINISWAISAIGLYNLLKFQESAQEYRTRLLRLVKPGLSERFQKALEKDVDNEEKYLSFFKDKHVLIPLMLALCVALGLVCGYFATAAAGLFRN